MDKGAGRTAERGLIVTGVAAALVGFSIAHALEDFVYGVPERFGFETAPAAALVGLIYAVHAVLIALSARGSPLGHLGNAAVGVAWFLAAVLDHLGEVLFAWPYRAGVVSKLFEVGLIASGLALTASGLWAWLPTRRPAGEPAPAE